MNQPVCTFHFPNETSVARLAARLTDLAPVSGPPPVSARRQFLDTFDWRLFESGLELELVRGGGETLLRLTERSGARRPVEIEVEAAPRTASDLPPGALRERLAPLLGPRALLVRADEPLRLWRGAVTDAEDKVVARLEISGRARGRGALAQIRTVRGYPSSAKALAHCLGRDLGGEPWKGDPLLLATAGQQPAPGEHPRWRSIAPIAPDARADRAVQGLLAHYSAIMDLNVDGTRDALDPEFLHDFRIGLRRCRTLLRRMPGLFPARRVEVFSRDLAWLGAITGPVRDLDVYALEFPGYLRTLPALDPDALDALLAHVEHERTRAHAGLASALSSARFKRRWAAWLAFVNGPLPASPGRAAARARIVDVARERIAKVARKVYREGDRISEASPADDYHDLRKRCKNLRYLYEAFESLDSGRHLKRVIGTLKAVQDVLGEHQDLFVHGDALARLADALEGPEAAATREAAHALRAELDSRALAARSRFAETYAALRALDLHKATFGR